MSEGIPVENRARLAAAEFDALRVVLAAQTSMERALAWFSARTPPLAPDDLIAQDEFSYDLLVPFGEKVYLSYDTS